jgi:hypothetical protein
MSYPVSEDCSSHLHEYCTLCECECHDRKEEESQRDWLKRNMVMRHWMQTDYYQAKLEKDDDLSNTRG